MQTGHDKAFLWTVDVGINNLLHFKNGMDYISSWSLVVVSKIIDAKLVVSSELCQTEFILGVPLPFKTDFGLSAAPHLHQVP